MHTATTLCALALATLCGSRVDDGVQPTDPRAGALLARAQAALGAVQNLHVRGNLLRIFALENLVSRVDGELWIQRKDGGLRLRVSAEILLQSGTPRVRADLLFEEGRWQFVDHLGRFMQSGDAPHLAGRASLLAHDFAACFLEGPSPVHGERAVAGDSAGAGSGHPTTRLVLRSEDGSSQTVWTLDASDALPRGFERRVNLERGETLTERLSVEELESSALSDSDFRIAVPADYARRAPGEDSPQRPLRLRQEREIDVVSLVDSLDPLRDRFNASKAGTRVVGLFAPT